MFWDQGLGQCIGCLSAQTTTKLLHVLCLHTRVRIRGFVRYSGGALRPVSNPVIRLPCWHGLMGIPGCIGDNVSPCLLQAMCWGVQTLASRAVGMLVTRLIATIASRWLPVI